MSRFSLEAFRSLVRKESKPCTRDWFIIHYANSVAHNHFDSPPGLTGEVGKDLYFRKSEEEISPSGIEGVYWYYIHPNGTKQRIVYCNPTDLCRFERFPGPSCPEWFSRLEMDGILTLVLKNVTKADLELMFQRRIEPNVRQTTAPKPKPVLDYLKIQDILGSTSGKYY